MSSNGFRHFLSIVKAQIRSKEGRSLVEKELLSHLHKSKAADIRAGKTEQEAERAAVERMGSAVKLGQQMNRLHRPKIDWWLILLVTCLLLFSFAPVWFIDIQSIRVQMQIASVLLSLIVMFAFMFIDFRRWVKLWKWFIASAVIYIVAYFVLHGPFKVMLNGKEYFHVFGITVPHQILLLILFIGLIGFFTYQQLSQLKLISLSLVLLWVPIFTFQWNLQWVLIIQYVSLFFIMMYLSNIKKKTKKWIAALNGGACILFIMFSLFSIKPYQVERLKGFLFPENHASSYGYMYMKMKEIIGASSWFGEPSIPYLDFIPEAHTTFVLVMLSYNGGWLLTIFIVFIYLLIIGRLCVSFFKVNDIRARLLMSGGLLLLFLPFVLNILLFLGFIPIIDVNFPLISYGGSEKIYYSVLIGLMLSVYRRKAFYQVGNLKSR
ncbi:FtsW/RodA/SpoVE family cell cycle protein [Halalkalibacter urbisdiaboli]|uniref:FtsW/RodA/SpoVE family cell cycle protein n=1 Tax=Halalkalibacter urbisdiaboli TaxID=1960589 RepID=UPI0013FD7155|nr:FtsW/RodA/SpoVE family cell cycle protein [Halalkalibacter urbisdiaboli]